MCLSVCVHNINKKKYESLRSLSLHVLVNLSFIVKFYCLLFYVFIVANNYKFAGDWRKIFPTWQYTLTI